MHGFFLCKTNTVLKLLMIFKKCLNKSSCKLSKVWVAEGSEFHNRSMKSWL